MYSMVQTDCTAEQLRALPRRRRRCEFVRGALHTLSSAGWPHGAVAARVARLLGNHVDAHRLGVVFAAETGCWIEHQPDTGRAADVSFVGRERMAARAPGPGFFPGAPDLAIEVLSPADALRV
jgi:Uma2 family endonuclease